MRVRVFLKTDLAVSHFSHLWTLGVGDDLHCYDRNNSKEESDSDQNDVVGQKVIGSSGLNCWGNADSVHARLEAILEG